MPAKRKAIVFDLDGTLVDSMQVAVESFHYALAPYGIELSLDDFELLRSKGHGDLFVDLIGTKENQIALERLYLYARSNVHRVGLIKGVRELLTDLHRINKPLFVWTGRDRASAEKILQINKVSHLFSAVHGCCGVAINKPHPEGLLKIANDLKIQPSEPIHIGDHSHDIEGAHSIQAYSIGVKWQGLSSPLYSTEWSTSPHYATDCPLLLKDWLIQQFIE